VFEINPLVRREALEEREYQLRIAGEAVKRNTLVVLPTALGKTVIAALVASHFLYRYSDRKVLVMAPTRPLVLQHRNTFLRLLKLRPEDVQILTGKHPPDFRLRAWSGPARLYFATPQVVYNDWRLGMKLDRFSLLVFDECHRARKNYAYTRVAGAYMREAPYPIILGLTASPGADRKKIGEICGALCIEHIEARTEEDPDVRPHLHPVQVDWRFVRLPASYQGMRKALRAMLEEKLRRLASMGAIRKDPRYVFRSDLLELGEELRYRLEETPLEEERGRLLGTIAIQSSALTLFHALELLESQGPHALRCFLNRIRESRRPSHRTLASELELAGVWGALDSMEEHPKVEVLEGILRQQLSENPSSNAIVFTQYRDTASHLVSRLRGLGLACARFVGQSDRAGDEGMSQEEQARLLEGFRSGGIRILVATSIAEEGLDIPSVDLVVFYEPVPSEIRYIQRKGRTGRRRLGRVVVLAAEGTLDVGYLRASQRMAERMKRVVESLNSELAPVPRSGTPQEHPMPAELIAEAEKRAPELPEAGPELAELEEELERRRLREFRKEVYAVCKRLLARILRSGGEGASLADLGEELEGGASPGVLRAAIQRLKDEGQVRELGGKLLPAGAGAARPSDVHTFEVERVLPGKAVLFVDGKFRAVLTPEEYTGPRQLIRRGSRFRAAAKLYRLNGKLHARIYAVERAE